MWRNYDRSRKDSHIEGITCFATGSARNTDNRKVEGVTLWRRGVRYDGTLHLTSHHIIFSYVPPKSELESAQSSSSTSKPRELWIAYPMIAFCTYRPAPTASRQQSYIRLRCRDFTFIAFHFPTESKAKDTYETIRNLTCRLGRIEKLYAFNYQAQGPEKQVNGWTIYNPMEEYRRMGVGINKRNKGWRVTNINADYKVGWLAVSLSSLHC